MNEDVQKECKKNAPEQKFVQILAHVYLGKQLDTSKWGLWTILLDMQSF